MRTILEKLCEEWVLRHRLICEYIGYMGQNPSNVTQWVEKPDGILDKIDDLE